MFVFSQYLGLDTYIDDVAQLYLFVYSDVVFGFITSVIQQKALSIFLPDHYARYDVQSCPDTAH